MRRRYTPSAKKEIHNLAFLCILFSHSKKNPKDQVHGETPKQLEKETKSKSILQKESVFSC